MKNTQRGFITIIVVTAALIALGIGIYLLFFKQNNQSTSVSDMTNSTHSVQDVVSTTTSSAQLTASSQENDTDPDTQKCLNDAKTTLDSSGCVQVQFNRDDQKLNRTYQALITTIEDHIANKDMQTIHANSLIAYEKNLKTAEKTWTTYRDQMCASISGIDTLNGTVGQIDYPLCQSRLTKQQINELTTVYSNWFHPNGS